MKKAIILSVLFLLCACLSFGTVTFINKKQLEKKAMEEAREEGMHEEYPEYVEPPFNEGIYYPDGDSSSAYWFEVKEKTFTFCGDVDKAIADLDVTYFDEIDAAGSENSSNAPQRDGEAPAEEEQDHPTYKELTELAAGGKLEYFVYDSFDNEEEKDDQIYIGLYPADHETELRMTYMYIYVFDYISEKEFSRNGKTFKLAE